MKLPIWAKNKEGKWEVFPYHLLETFSDGKLGLIVFSHHDWEIWKKLDPWIHLFTYETAKRRYILKKQHEGQKT